MNKIKSSLLVIGLLLMTACTEQEIEYTKTDFRENPELIEQVITDFEANKNPSNIDRKNYDLAKTEQHRKQIYEAPATQLKFD